MSNRERWKAMLPIIQAYVAGADIDYLFGVRWVAGEPGDKFNFNQPPSHYRIAKRDWAWACEQMTAGKKVQASHQRLPLFLSGGRMNFAIEARDLIATDYRIVGES